MPASDRQPSRPGSEAATLTERAAMLVEQDILAGHLAPGSRLGIVDLVQRYEIGATPLREGLSRLMSRGLIVGIGQRGFRVADISREDLLDITCMRTAVEVEAIRLAIVNGDDVWEAGIVSSLHQMRRHIERTGDEFREGADPVLVRSRIDLVTGLEAPHPCSHLDHNAGDVVAENKWKSVRQEDFEFSVGDLCIEEIDAGSVDLDEYVIVPDLRLR